MNKKNNPYKKGLRELTVYEKEKLNKILEEIPKSELPRIRFKLSKFSWAEELGEPPVSFFRNRYACEELHYIMEQIDLCCGYKAVMRYEHVEENLDTEQMFEDWWDSRCLDEIEELQQELDKRDYQCNESNNKRNDCDSFSKSLLFFILGILVTAIFKLLIGGDAL